VEPQGVYKAWSDIHKCSGTIMIQHIFPLKIHTNTVVKIALDILFLSHQMSHMNVYNILELVIYLIKTS
jgi:hypothetical protein